jgi:hypothetical protein
MSIVGYSKLVAEHLKIGSHPNKQAEIMQK